MPGPALTYLLTAAGIHGVAPMIIGGVVSFFVAKSAARKLMRNMRQSPNYAFDLPTNTADPSLPVAVAHGRVLIGGNVIFMTTPGKDVTEIVGMCEGEIESVQTVYANNIILKDETASSEVDALKVYYRSTCDSATVEVTASTIVLTTVNPAATHTIYRGAVTLSDIAEEINSPNTGEWRCDIINYKYVEFTAPNLKILAPADAKYRNYGFPYSGNYATLQCTFTTSDWTLTGCNYTAYMGTPTQDVTAVETQEAALSLTGAITESQGTWTTTGGGSLRKVAAASNFGGEAALNTGITFKTKPYWAMYVTGTNTSGVDYYTHYTLNNIIDVSGQTTTKFGWYCLHPQTVYGITRVHLEDSLGNATYWNFTYTEAVIQTISIDLSSPDGSIGAPADLTDIIKFTVHMQPNQALYGGAHAIMGVVLDGATIANYVGGLRNLALLELFLHASEQLPNTPEIFAEIEGRKEQVWNGAAWITEYTYNPAWIIRAYLSSTRFGLGIVDANIDDDSFKAVATTCDAQVTCSYDGADYNRWTMHFIHDVFEDPFELLESLLMHFNAYLLYLDGKWSLHLDEDKASIQSFTTANIIENTFTYGKTQPQECYNSVTIWYKDPGQMWLMQPVTEKISYDIEARGENNLEMELPGVNNPFHARRLARIYLNVSFFNRFTCAFTAGIDSIHCVPGDIVEITHPVPGWVAKKFRVIKSEEQENDEVSMQFREHNPDVYTDNADGVLSTITENTFFPGNNSLTPPTAPSYLTVAEGGILQQDNTWLAWLDVEWEGARGDWIIGYEVEIKKGTDAWVPYETPKWPSSRIDNPDNNVDYYVRVRTVGQNVKSAWTEDGPTAIVGNPGVPGNLVFVQPTAPTPVPADKSSFFRELLVSWDAITGTNGDALEAEIRDEDANWGTQDAHQFFSGLGTSFAITDPDPAVTAYTLYGKWRNRAGNWSAAFDTITLTNAVPANVGVIATIPQYKKVIFTWPPNTDKDIKGYKYRTAVDNSFTVTASNNNMDFTSDQGTAIIAVDAGTYTGAEMATELETKMQANATITGGVIAWVVTYNGGTNKFTIDAGVGHTVALDFSDSDAAERTFGFTADQASAPGTSILSDAAVYGSWRSWIEDEASTQSRELTDAEILVVGETPSMYIEALAMDIFEQESAVATTANDIPDNATTLYIENVFANDSDGLHLGDVNGGVGLFLQHSTLFIGLGSTDPQGVLDLGAGANGRSLVWGGATGAAHYASIGTTYSSADLSLLAGLKLNPAADTVLYAHTGTYAPLGIRMDRSTGEMRFFAEASGAKTKGNAFDDTANETMSLDKDGNLAVGNDLDVTTDLRVGGSLNVTGDINGNLVILGAWDAGKAVANTYQATEDGTVHSLRHAGAGFFSGAVGYTDGNADPTGTQVAGHTSGAAHDDASFAFHVKKDDYWRVDGANWTVLFIPFGADQ